jgi:WD domain, G-beta repeat
VAEGKRRALLVSADTYGDATFRKLRSPAIDAAALKRVLVDPAVGGFRVDVSHNEPAHIIQNKIETFFKTATVDDFLLLHFGCHGVKDSDGELYFATSNTKFSELDSTAVPAAFVNRHMGRTRSRRVVMLLDCCYSGAFARGGIKRVRSAAVVDIGERFKQGHGHFILTASTAMEYASDGEQLNKLGDVGPSVFTGVLVRGLETGEADLDQDGHVSFRDLADYVDREVKAAKSKQTPQAWYLEKEGDLYIAQTAPAARRKGRAAPRRRNYAALRPQLELAAPAEVFSVDIAFGSRTLAAGSNRAILLWRQDREIATWRDPPRPQEIKGVHTGFVYSVAFSPDGRRLATGGEDGVVHVRDLERGKVWATKHHTEAVYSVAFSPDGSLLASGGYDRRVLLLDAEGGALQRELGRLPRVSSVAFSPSHTEGLLAIGGLDNTITLWDLGTGDHHVLAEPRHQSSVERIIFSPDGSLLASCGLDKAVRVYETALEPASWKRVFVNTMDHEYLVRGLAFAPDGATLASASWDKTIKIWNVDSHVPTLLAWQPRRPRHTDWIWSVAFSPDGRVLASGGSDSKVILWMLPGAE